MEYNYFGEMGMKYSFLLQVFNTSLFVKNKEKKKSSEMSQPCFYLIQLGVNHYKFYV